jgi:hypothetical protein
MKTLNLIITGISAGALLLACASANAIPADSITVDDNGNYSSSPSGLIIGSSVASQTYFSPAATVLTYYFSTVYPLSSIVPVEGVVDIYSDAAHTELADVVVFAPNGPSYIYFMSLDNPSSLAYVSSVPAFVSDLTVIASVTEGAGGVTTYTPTGPNGPDAQPGFTDNATMTYTFVDNSSVPDGGATIVLLGLGLLGVYAVSRKLSRQAQPRLAVNKLNRIG